MSGRTHTLATRIGRRILYILLLLLIATAAMLAITAWQDEAEDLESRVIEVGNAFSRPLSESLWLVDRPLVESQLQAMVRIPGIAHVTVHTFTRNEFHFDARDSSSHEPILIHRITLRHQDHDVGTLEIAADRTTLVAAVQGHLVQMLGIFTVLLAAGGYALFRTLDKEAAAPLRDISAQIANWTPGDDAPPLRTDALYASEEMTRLARAFSEMRSSLATHLQRQRDLQRDLAQNRDQLAELAEYRERRLSFLEGLERHALNMSTGLISLPHEMIVPQIARSLTEIGRYGGLDFAGVLVPDGDAGCHIDTYWQSERLSAPVALSPNSQHDLSHWAQLHLAAHAVLRIDNLAKTTEASLAEFQRLGLGSLVAIPLQVRDSQHGILLLGRARNADADEPWGDRETGFFELLGQIVASALAQQRSLQQLDNTQQDLQVANTELERLSRTDPLTALANRRAFDEARARETSRARRTRSPLALLLLDVDHFKAYNDTLGHAEGDVCLATIASLLGDAARRPGDLAARVGGEEFALLLPDTDAAGAARLFEELRLALHHLALPHPDSATSSYITISGGAAELASSDVESFDDLYLRCDRALYAAKHAGRDRCVVAEYGQATAAR